MRRKIYGLLLSLTATAAGAQTFDQFDNNGPTQLDNNLNRNFNKHNNDTTSNKEIPIGLHAWTIDRKFGDMTPVTPDTVPHLYPNTTLNTGLYGQYNTTGNNYTARENRIVADRPLADQFIFTQPYSHVMRRPDQVHFTNTLSPFTNISYDNCGDKTNGEDHIDAKFAVNAGKRLGMGFDLNYSYARGYYAAQNASHFGATFHASYLGDKYNMHAVLSTYHQKVAENGGITDDNYITHPESFDDSYGENEIPTVLDRNWNRNDNTHLFLTHRYNLGFYRMEKMTDEEIKARQFAAESEKEHRDKIKADGREQAKDRQTTETSTASGRPDDAVIAGDEPAAGATTEADTTRIKVESQEKMDSLLAEKERQDSIAATMKRVFVPVTSFIHTLDINKHERIYQAYETPQGYYADTFYNYGDRSAYGGDSIYDVTRMTSVKNTLAIAMLEGFNKYAKAGLRVFASHEFRNFKMPSVAGFPDTPEALEALGAFTETWKEHSLSVGGQIIKSQGKTLHYNLMAETWIAGEDAGQLKADFSTDLNFPLLGDTVTLAARAYFYRLNPTFYQRRYHSKHIWWDRDDLGKETRTRVEGSFTYRKTKTTLRVAVEEIQNYTYFGMSYDATTDGRTNMTAGVRQAGGNINLLTAQLMQNFRLGPLNWENVVTYQNSSNTDVLPVPALNLFTNLYLKFKIAKVLSVEFGGDAYFFTKYYAPDFSPQLNQFAIQENGASRVKLGGYPFVDVYANMHLKHARFFLMFSHANAGNGTNMYFLAPHYPQNSRVMRIGVSWNFFN